MDYRAFQAEHRAWLDKMFPNQAPEMPASGMVEEAGELMHALLKSQQETVWGKESRYHGVSWYERILDAIGDCAIYTCSLANTCGWDFEQMVGIAKLENMTPMTALQQVVELVEHGCRTVLQPRRRSYAIAYLSTLNTIANCWNIGLESALEASWSKVKLRNRNETGRQSEAIDG